MNEGEQKNVDLFEKTLNERNALRDEILELRVVASARAAGGLGAAIWAARAASIRNGKILPEPPKRRRRP